MRLTVIIGLIVILAISSDSYSKDSYSKERYRVQNVEGKVLERKNSRSGGTGANSEYWHKVKRNQWISENAVLDIKPGGKIKICDTQTSRIYKSQNTGRTNIGRMIGEAKDKASKVTKNVIKQLKGGAKKPLKRYRYKERGVVTGLRLTTPLYTEEEIRKKDSINATLIDYDIFHRCLREHIYNKLSNEESIMSNGLKGTWLRDSTENVYLKVKNETSKGLFINIYVPWSISPTDWQSIMRSFYLPAESEIDLTEYSFEPSEDLSVLLLGTEDEYDDNYLQEIYFEPSEALRQKSPLSLIIPKVEIDAKSKK